MNRNLYRSRKSSNSSRIFCILKLQRICAGLALVVSISGTAAAQYPSGGGGTSNYPGGTRPSYGSKGAVIGGVAAGAAGAWAKRLTATFGTSSIWRASVRSPPGDQRQDHRHKD